MGGLINAITSFFVSIGVNPIVGAFFLGVIATLLVKRKSNTAGPLGNTRTDFTTMQHKASVSQPGMQARAHDHMLPSGASRLGAQIAGIVGNAVLPEVSELIRSGQKIEAIKRVREKTGLGLKEAKDLVDRWEKLQNG